MTPIRLADSGGTSEPLLAIPDAVGWAWARGGDWRRRAQPMIGEVIDLRS
jgi:hypothetical protein